MGMWTGTHLEALTEATGAMTVAAMQDMSFGFGIGGVLAEVRVRMPRLSADFQGGHVGGHGSISSMCANHDRGFSSSDRPSPEARNSRRAERGRRFRASRFSHPPRGRRHSPPRVCASRRVLRDGEEGKKREEGQEGQEVRAPPPPPAAPRAAPAARVEPPRSRSFSPTAAPDDDPPGFANPSQDAQEETVAQRALLLFFLLRHVFRYRGQRGCAPPPRLQDGTRTSVQRDPRTEIEARSILHRGRRAAREPVVDVADPSPPPASSSSTTARRSPLAGEEAGRASETGRDRRVHRRREPLRRRQLDGALRVAQEDREEPDGGRGREGPRFESREGSARGASAGDREGEAAAGAEGPREDGEGAGARAHAARGGAHRSRGAREERGGVSRRAGEDALGHPRARGEGEGGGPGGAERRRGGGQRRVRPERAPARGVREPHHAGAPRAPRRRRGARAPRRGAPREARLSGTIS